MSQSIPRVCLPQIGAKAPDFTAQTTMGSLTLSDYTGSWVVLFSHPADFTPVCTTEFIAFAQYAPSFEERNTKLIGLSVDSVYSHLGWLENIQRHTGVEIPFPVVADLDMKIAHLYGMVSPGISSTTTVRSVYIIDGQQVLRAILYYPQTNGRNIPEILRLIEAMQLTDKEQISTPANWMPGYPVIVPPPSTYAGVKERLQSSEHPCMDWYLCQKPAEQ
ncbi:peroxiredoxin [Aneurinibacillus sp. Ricciae_BoGa-3]|uniref:peroxiredoxin n=1 Tax=Aneurinibacillus sp. Ricciae_BoGa-3 TaxID=3022697 RepID=UPI002340A833|nr:peroxiredoxin [Aneurinibacillus sp. Ricciae_BoGa-3]WCK55844.1 peroxiredoxin [Aneurinibacillus sp. Ricciae_BoGa-3]